MPSSVWYNIIALRGVVAAASGGSYEITVGSPGQYHGQKIGLTAWSGAEWSNLEPGGLASSILYPGDAVDVIGGDRGGAIIATRIQFLRAGIVLPAAISPPQIVQGPDNICYMYWYGNSSYFDCPTGDGACGTCSTSNNAQGAWPYVFDHCNYECTSQCGLYCGDGFYLWPCAGDTSYGITIADNGPCQASTGSCPCSPTLCSQGCGDDPCSLDYTDRICDLTAPTFARFASPTKGCLSVRVGIAVECGSYCPY
jgi:hypothetical protein